MGNEANLSNEQGKARVTAVTRLRREMEGLSEAVAECIDAGFCEDDVVFFLNNWIRGGHWDAKERRGVKVASQQKSLKPKVATDRPEEPRVFRVHR